MSTPYKKAKNALLQNKKENTVVKDLCVEKGILIWKTECNNCIGTFPRRQLNPFEENCMY